MRKKILLSIIMAWGIGLIVNAQSNTSNIIKAAHNFLQNKDYENAIIILKNGLQLDPKNLDYSKELTLSYYFSNNLSEAQSIIMPLLKRADADDQCFQIAGNILKQSGALKDCEKIYKRGLKRFPRSGPLHNDYGELLWCQRNYTAIDEWEKGIEKDPSYSSNFYNATRFYFSSTEPIRGIIYGEIFLNMEPNSPRSPEIKKIVFDGYKKFFAYSNTLQTSRPMSGFEKAFFQTLEKQKSVLSNGVNIENLFMVRSRFILDWHEAFAKKYPFFLFEYHNQLLQEGLFESYNWWLFGPAYNLSSFQQWTQKNAIDYNRLIEFREKRIFRMPAGQYYGNK